MQTPNLVIEFRLECLNCGWTGDADFKVIDDHELVDAGEAYRDYLNQEVRELNAK